MNYQTLKTELQNTRYSAMTDAQATAVLATSTAAIGALAVYLIKTLTAEG